MDMLASVDPPRLKFTNQEGTQGVLLGSHCLDCGVYIFGSAVFCQGCICSNLQPVELARCGTLYGYTVLKQQVGANWTG